MKSSPISWYGGKTYIAKKVLGLFPTHQIYCEVFGGSGGLMFKKPKSPVEIYNDIDDDVVNFFQVLRDNPEELQRRLKLTPFARAEHKRCKEVYDETLDPIEKARMFFVLVRQSYGSIFKDSWGYGLDHSRSTPFRQVVNDLLEYAERFREVQIENASFENIFERYDSPDTLFYVDPPYLHETRSKSGVYQHEMTTEQHEKLIDTIRELKGMVILSGYASPLYDEALVYWDRFEFVVRNPVCQARHGVYDKPTRTEVVWASPSIRQAMAKDVIDFT